MIEVLTSAARALFSEAGVIALLLFLALLYTLYRESVAVRRLIALQDRMIALAEQTHMDLDRQLHVLNSIRDNQANVLGVIRERLGGKT